jgi:RNA-directed DNA polymerase
MSFSQEELKAEALLQGHSRKFVKGLLAYAKELKANDLPVIFSTYHLALLFKVEYKDIISIIRDRGHYYKYYCIKKRNGGNRQIVVPFETLKYIQRCILTYILNQVTPSEQAFAYVSGRSIRDNAVRHSGQPAILKIDLVRFFDCITETKIYRLFRDLGYNPGLSVDLAKLVTAYLPEEYLSGFSAAETAAYNSLFRHREAVLPQGAPTSPALSNLMLRPLDKRLQALANKQQCLYSRYADDIVFSGEANNLPNLSLLKKIIGEEGFLINWNKVGLHQKGRRQLITGLTVADGVHVPRHYKKDVKKHLYGCLHFGVENHLAHVGTSSKGFYKEWLLGRIFYIKGIEPDYGNALLADFNKIVWPL